MDISIIIVVKDNPPYIKKALNSIKNIASEIILLDIGMDVSLRRSIESEYKPLVRVETINKPVPYVEIIREESKQYTKHEWIFFLDPDEVVSDSLINVLKKHADTYDYFKIPRKNIIFTKWIQNSRWWPDYQVRFFKKNNVVWSTQIHQQPQLEGKGYDVEAKEEYALTHYNYENIDEYFTKAVRYAKAEAQTYSNKKFTLKDAIEKALSEFISRFFSDNGYKDGMHGFVLSFMQMFYYFIVYFYYWESKQYKTEENVPQESQNFFKQGLIETNHWIQKKYLYKPNIKQKIISKFVKEL